jgi:carbon storage regulator CsrA
MLVLTRRPGEGIYIKTSEGEIEIRMLSLAGLQIRVGIAAPKSMTIHRDDIIKKEIKDDDYFNR